MTAPTHNRNTYTILDGWTDSSHSHQQHVYHSWQMNWQHPLTSATCIPFLTDELTAATHISNMYTILDRWTYSSQSHQQHVYHSWQKWQHPLTTGILIPFLTDELTAATHIRNMYTTLDRRSDSTHSQQEHFYHSWQMTWHQPLTSGILIQFWTDELTVAAHISNTYSILDRNDSTYSQQEHLYHSWQMNWQQPLKSGTLKPFLTKELIAETLKPFLTEVLTAATHNMNMTVYYSWQKYWQLPLTTGKLTPFLSEELTAATHKWNKNHSWQKNWQQQLTSGTLIHVPFLIEELTAATHITNKYFLTDEPTAATHIRNTYTFLKGLTAANHIRNIRILILIDRWTDSCHSQQEHLYHSWQKNWQQPLTTRTLIPLLTEELTAATHIRNTYTILHRWTDSSHSHQEHLFFLTDELTAAITNRNT